VFTRTYTLAPQLQRAAALNTEAKYEVRVQQAGAATLATVLKNALPCTLDFRLTTELTCVVHGNSLGRTNLIPRSAPAHTPVHTSYSQPPVPTH
jgi:hypothetical protein